MTEMLAAAKQANRPMAEAEARSNCEKLIADAQQVTQGSWGSLWNLLQPAKWVAGALGWVAVFLLQIASLITYLSGVVLNFVIQFTVVNMKANLNDVETINNAWKTIRDLGNMGFIFVLLYAAITTILGTGKDNKQLIVRVVVVAILINFSLFFTKVVIDISNVLAVTFYDAIAPGALGNNVSLGLSNSIMDPLKITSIFKAAGELEGQQLLIVGVMGTIVALIAAFVFFAVAILFIIRFVVLIFVLILSPIAFLSYVLPKMDKYRKQWSEALIGQAFFAPIYFLLTWIVIVIARGLPTYPGSAMSAALSGIVKNGETVPDPSSLGLLINFFIVIALLITSLVIAKEWANKAGGGMNKLTSWATGVAGGATLGMAGRFGRNTLGRAGVALGENEKLKAAAAEGGAKGMAARLALVAGRKTGGAGFDIRATGLGGTLGAGKAAGKGGFAKFREEKAKEEAKFAASLGPSDKEIAYAQRDLEQYKEGDASAAAYLEKERRKERKKIQKEIEKLNSQKEGAASRGASGMGLNKIDAEINRAKTRYAATESVGAYAQERVDRLKGISGKDSPTRVKDLEIEKNKALESDPLIEKAKKLQEQAAKVEQNLISNDPVLKKEKEIADQVKQKEDEVNATIIPELKAQKISELEAVRKELERAKKDSEVRMGEIKERAAISTGLAGNVKEHADKRAAEIEKEFEARKALAQKRDGAGEIRKKAFANSVESSLFAAARGYNYAAAAQIRKGKTSKDKAAEALKELARESGVETEEEGAKEEKPKEEKEGGETGGGGTT